MKIAIAPGTAIDEEELVFAASRSSGPGGQNVNKVSSRAAVRFDVVKSASLSAEQKKLILRRLAARANKAGVIQVAAQQYRSQAANRQAAQARLIELLRTAFKLPRVRKKTRVPYRAKERRLEEKKQRGRLKQQRAKSDED